MGIEVIEEREQEARDRKLLKAWKEEFCRINLEVFVGPKAKSPCKKPTRKGKEKETALEAMIEPLPLLPRLFDANLRATSPTKAPTAKGKGKGKEKASKEEIEPRKKSKGLQEEERAGIEADAQPEMRTRVGRAVKRTSKAQKGL
jgi:hypothetical protein